LFCKVISYEFLAALQSRAQMGAWE
jgi:hypothetical protein